MAITKKINNTVFIGSSGIRPCDKITISSGDLDNIKSVEVPFEDISKFVISVFRDNIKFQIENMSDLEIIKMFLEYKKLWKNPT